MPSLRHKLDAAPRIGIKLAVVEAIGQDLGRAMHLLTPGFLPQQAFPHKILPPSRT